MKPKPTELVDKLLARLNRDNQDWADKAQVAEDARYDAAEDLLLEAGYTGVEENWDDLKDELANSAVFVPEHFTKAIG